MEFLTNLKVPLLHHKALSELQFINILNSKKFTKEILVPIGDDASILKFGNKNMVVTMDSLNVNTHFSYLERPEVIGYKSLAVNISDLAAMGALPKYVLLSLTIDERDNLNWIKKFHTGFKKLLKKYNIQLIGGDMNKGPVSISITLFGETNNRFLKRENAKVNEDIWVSGFIGESFLGFMKKNNPNFKIGNNCLNNFIKKHDYPIPRVELGLKIKQFSSTCIDISDGLLLDLKRILKKSAVGADIFFDKIPIPKKIKRHSEKNSELFFDLITGGEDYELLFTSNRKNRNRIMKLGQKLKIKLTQIGEIKKHKNLKIFDKNFKNINLPHKLGHDHF